MSTAIRAAFWREWDAADAARGAGDLGRAFHHLERAHILSQRITWLHLRSHIGMLRIGWQRQDAREVIGQMTRIVAALLFSRLWVPIGNTGGAHISAFRPMPVPDDLNALLRCCAASMATLCNAEAPHYAAPHVHLPLLPTRLAAPRSCAGWLAAGRVPDADRDHHGVRAA